jgi:hypothetical protein
MPQLQLQYVANLVGFEANLAEIPRSVATFPCKNKIVHRFLEMLQMRCNKVNRNVMKVLPKTRLYWEPLNIR